MKKNLLILPVIMFILLSCGIEYAPLSENGIYISQETIIITPSVISATKTLKFAESTTAENELEEKVSWLQNMFEGTEECSFPCVADHAFVVGETSFEEAVENISVVYKTYLPIDNIDEGELMYEFGTDIVDSPYYSAFYLISKDSKVFSASFFFYTSLSDFLLRYGPPDEIWAFAEGIKTFSTTGWFQIILLYEDEGIFVTFDGDTSRSIYMDICEAQLDIERLNITLFDSTYVKSHSFSSMMEKYPQYFAIPADMVLFEEISNIDVVNFYKMFSAPDSSNCFSLMDIDYYLDPDSFPFVEPSPTPIVLN